MKKLVALLLMAGALSCQKNEQITVEPNPTLGPVQEVNGTLSDYAAVDGCGLLLFVERSSTNTDEYALSDSSATLVKQYVAYTNGVAKVNVTVRFQLTGQQKKVSCGFSGLKPFDEVAILSIKPR